MRKLEEIGADIVNVLRTRQYLTAQLEAMNGDLRKLEAEALAWQDAEETAVIPLHSPRPAWLDRGHSAL